MLLTKLMLLVCIAESAAQCFPGDKKTVFTVEVEFRQLPLKKSYSHVKLITSNKRFSSGYSEYSKARENYDSMDTSVSVSGSYGPFSASVSADYASVTQRASSMSEATGSTLSGETYSERENKQWQTFFVTHFQIMRDVAKTVTINGVSATVQEQDIVDVKSIDDRLSYEELEQLGRDFITERYGTETHGKILGNGNVFSQTQCYSTKHPKVWKPVEKEVYYPLDKKNVPVYVKTSALDQGMGLYVRFYDETGGKAGGVNLRYSPINNKLVYFISWCTYFNAEVPAPVDARKDRTWRISKTTEPRILVLCEGKEVLNLKVSDKLCPFGDWSHYWFRDAAKVKFDELDVSDSYASGTCPCE